MPHSGQQCCWPFAERQLAGRKPFTVSGFSAIKRLSGCFGCWVTLLMKSAAMKGPRQTVNAVRQKCSFWSLRFEIGTEMFCNHLVEFCGPGQANNNRRRRPGFRDCDRFMVAHDGRGRLELYKGAGWFRMRDPPQFAPWFAWFILKAAAFSSSGLCAKQCLLNTLYKCSSFEIQTLKNFEMNHNDLHSAEIDCHFNRWQVVIDNRSLQSNPSR